MNFIIGCIVVVGCVFGGYVWHGGQLGVLWQPTEVLIIGGAALGGFIIGNPMDYIKDVGAALKKLFKSKPYSKKEYTELLLFLTEIFKLIKTKGMLEIESHIEAPNESEIFKKYPSVINNSFLVHFFCDYVRMMTMGMDDPHQIDDLMTADIDGYAHDLEEASGAITNIADGMPALGIVAAVLGVINTMKSITEPPEILGGLIAAALVGTFLGVWLAYSFIGPAGNYVAKYQSAEINFIKVVKTAIISQLQGNAPAVTVEFARNVIPHHDRPNFAEIEEAQNADK